MCWGHIHRYQCLTHPHERGCRLLNAKDALRTVVDTRVLVFYSVSPVQMQKSRGSRVMTRSDEVPHERACSRTTIVISTRTRTICCYHKSALKTSQCPCFPTSSQHIPKKTTRAKRALLSIAHSRDQMSMWSRTQTFLGIPRKWYLIITSLRHFHRAA